MPSQQSLPAGKPSPSANTPERDGASHAMAATDAVTPPPRSHHQGHGTPSSDSSGVGFGRISLGDSAQKMATRAYRDATHEGMNLLVPSALTTTRMNGPFSSPMTMNANVELSVHGAGDQLEVAQGGGQKEPMVMLLDCNSRAPLQTL